MACDNRATRQIASRPQIDTSAVLAVLQPIWRRFPETSSRLRGRIEAVLDYAKARGLRTGESPAAWRGHLALILPKHGTAPRHHAAMPYGDVPAFVTCLHMSGSISSRAMEFAILTTARPGEVLGARWAEIDPDKKVWTVPASRMKGGREHRVPLSGRAAAVLVDLAKGRTGEFIFPGQHPNKHVSSRTLEMLLRRMKVDATPHGFRSSFRDWAAEATNFQREVVEQCLAHPVGNSVERAYQRGDVLKKRRAVLEAWASFCDFVRSEQHCSDRRKAVT